MIRRSTWIILLVFLAILGGGLFFQKFQSDKQAQVTPTAEFKLLFPGVDKSQITAFEIDDSQGRTLGVAKDQSGSWAVAVYTAADTDPTGIDGMLMQITSLEVLSDLDPAPALDIIGLTTPAYRFKVTLQDGQQKTVYIGKLTPTKSGYYARLESGNPVVVTKYAVDNLINLLDKPPIATPVPALPAAEFGVVTPTPQP
jgi:hypothetical protein